MDPDAALMQIRALYERWSPEDAEELAELIAGLDNWLSNGGFLPKAWTTPARR